MPKSPRDIIAGWLSQRPQAVDAAPLPQLADVDPGVLPRGESDAQRAAQAKRADELDENLKKLSDERLAKRTDEDAVAVAESD